MATATADRLMTAEEFLALPDDGVDRWLLSGVLYENRGEDVTKRNRRHSTAMMRIGHLLIRWADTLPEPRGEVAGGEAGFVLKRNPDSTVGIDVAYVSPETVGRQVGDTVYYNGPPLLAVEIWSPSNTHREVRDKVRDYLAAGVQVVWVVDPDDRTVKVMKPGQPPVTFNDTQTVPGDPSCPGSPPPWPTSSADTRYTNPHVADPRTDDDLLADARAGKAGAVDHLLGEFREPLRKVIGLRLDPVLARRVDASDIVQDVLIEANQRLTDYLKKPDMPFHLWLRHLAQDRIIDTHRRHRTAQRRSVDREQPIARPAWADESSNSLVAQLVDTERTPATQAIQEELARKLTGAIAKLGDDDREIILLRHHEQLANQDVASLLGLTEAAASMRYLRALRRLRTVLLPDGDGDGKDGV